MGVEFFTKSLSFRFPELSLKTHASFWTSAEITFFDSRPAMNFIVNERLSTDAEYHTNLLPQLLGLLGLVCVLTWSFWDSLKLFWQRFWETRMENSQIVPEVVIDRDVTLIWRDSVLGPDLMKKCRRTKLHERRHGKIFHFHEPGRRRSEPLGRRVSHLLREEEL